MRMPCCSRARRSVQPPHPRESQLGAAGLSPAGRAILRISHLINAPDRRRSLRPVAGKLTPWRTLVRILTIVASKAGQQPAPATDGDRAATLQLVIALGRALQAIERAVRPHLVQSGLGLTEFAVLEVLYHKGALPLGQIRDRILVTGASTTYVVKKLEERGLMRRRACAEDSRVVFGELTAKGRALIDEVFPVHVERLQRAMAGLSVSQKRDTSRLLRALGVHARRMTGERITEDD